MDEIKFLEDKINQKKKSPRRSDDINFVCTECERLKQLDSSRERAFGKILDELDQKEVEIRELHEANKSLRTKLAQKE